MTSQLEAEDWRFRKFRQEASKPDPRIAALARTLAGFDGELSEEDLSSPPEVLRLRALGDLLTRVQKRVRFVRTQSFQSPVETWVLGAGDCKSSATLFAALAASLGCRVRLWAFGPECDSAKATHVCAQVQPWKDAPWYWAETTIVGAELGESPAMAALRLGVVGRDDLGMAGLGDAGGGEHAVARQVIVAGFQRAVGRQPSTFEAQYLQAIALTETHYGTSWTAPCDSSHNWGGYQAKPDEESCAWSDSLPDGTRYDQPFKVYPDDVAGAADFIALIYNHMPDARAALEKGASVRDVSEALYYSHYYGAWCPDAVKTYGQEARDAFAFTGTRAASAGGRACESESIDMHASSIGSACDKIADALGEPRPPRETSILPTLALGAGLVGLGFLAWRQFG